MRSVVVARHKWEPPAVVPPLFNYMDKPLFICLLMLLYSLWVTHPTTDTISLRPETVSFTPTEYYIAEVIDDRSDKSSVGRWATASNQPLTAVNLSGGAAANIQQFIKQSLRQNTKLRRVALHITDLQLTESNPQNRPFTEGRISFGVAFYLLRSEDAYSTPAKLTEFRNTIRYSRPLSQPAVVEQSIRQSLVASLKYFNDYMNRESKNDERLASDIKVVFNDYIHNRANDDTVFYELSRPLTWKDFQATPRPMSRYAAEVNPNFAYTGRSSVNHGVITVSLTVKVFTLKSGSWARDIAKNEYSLNHEQRHFDIAKIVAERFKKKVAPDSLTIEDYNSIIQYQFIESYREMNKLQEKYDGETNHGLNQAEQARWNQWIDAELKKHGIKK